MKILRLTIILVLFSVNLVRLNAQVNLAVNGDFQSGTNGWAFSYTTNGPFQGASFFIYAGAAYLSGYYVSASISQSIKTIPGNYYEVSFAYESVIQNGEYHPSPMGANFDFGTNYSVFTYTNYSYVITQNNGASYLSSLQDFDFILQASETNSLLIFNVVGDEDGPPVDSNFAHIQVAAFAPISQQPQNQAQILGGDAAFSVTASSPAPFSYQWYFSNPALQTAAGALAQTAFGFCYGAMVTNGGSGYTTTPNVQFIGGSGTGASGTSTVSNGQIVAITIASAGSNYTTAPAVLIDPPNGLLIAQTNATLNLNGITTNDLGNYFVVVSNLYGSFTSSAAVLNQAYPPSISQQPTNLNASFGTEADFNVTAAGTSPFGYQWWMTGGPHGNATAVPVVTNGFVLTAIITSGGGGYLTIPAVQIVGGSGSGASGTAVVSNRMVTAINMSNAGSGYTAPPIIQIDPPTDINLTGQTNSNLALVAVTGTNAVNYFVVVTNNFGSVTSSPAALTIKGAAPQGMTLKSSGGGLELHFAGTPNYSYVLQSATNLAPTANWQPIFTNPAEVNGNWQFMDTNLTDAQRFYRVTTP